MRRLRTNARRRPNPPLRLGRAEFYNYGPQATDAVNGIQYPKRLMVPQRGGLVSARWSDGTRDLTDAMEKRHQPPTQLPTPVPLYRVATAAGLTIVITSEDERDDAVDSGYFWSVLGYAYTDGDEEDDLTPLYRAFSSGTSDHLFTTDAAEYAAALLAGYAAESVDAYVFTTTARNRVPVYRAYKASTGTHSYVATLADIGRLGTGWAFEQITCYVLTGEERTQS